MTRIEMPYAILVAARNSTSTTGTAWRYFATMDEALTFCRDTKRNTGCIKYRPGNAWRVER